MEKDWSGNTNSVWKTLGASNHTDNEREQDDYYATDPVAVDKLLAVEQPHTFIWECACGGGHLSERLAELGYNVFNTDIKNRGYEKQHCELDFLTQAEKPFNFEYDILTNPPYKFAKDFVLKALDLLHDGCRAYMFLKLTFLEGKARFQELFKRTPPLHIRFLGARSVRQKRRVSAHERRRRIGGSVCVVCLGKGLQRRNGGALDLRTVML